MQYPREQIVEALLAQASASISASFTANTTQGSAVLSNATALGPLAKGWPLFGPGIPRDTVVASLSPLTMSQPATANGTAIAITSGFRTTGRRLQFPDDVSEQPALFVRYLTDEYPLRPTGMPPKPVMECELWVYARSGNDPDMIPDQALNPLIDAIEYSLRPDPASNVQTLGGLVVHCWIEGKIEKNPGDLDNQAMAVIPIKMLAP